MRLHGGSNSSNGFVHVCVNSTWVGVCSDGWDSGVTRVVCNQLHYYQEGINMCGCELLYSTSISGVKISSNSCLEGIL